MPETLPRRSAKLRTVALVVHRYVGLVSALFLLVAGVTGSAIVFYDELDAALNPALHVEPPAVGAPRLDPLELRARLAAALPAGSSANFAPLDPNAGEAVRFFVDPGKERRSPNEYFLDPY